MKEVEETTVLACELVRCRLEAWRSKGVVSLEKCGWTACSGKMSESRDERVRMCAVARCGCLREARGVLVRRSGEG